MTTKTIGAMAFYHPNGLVPALEQALAFSAGGGKVATIPDILEARLRSHERSVAWSSYFTTMSAEYYGYSAAGVPLIAVAHGVGPMADETGVVSAYSYEFRDKTRSKRGGRISEAVFLKLIGGAFGAVDVVDVRSLVSAYEYPFSSRTPEELLVHPLWVARLGGMDLACRYVMRHSALALADLMENQNSLAQQEKVAGKIISMRDSNNAPYLRVAEGESRKLQYLPAYAEEGVAKAHLLSIGQLVNAGLGGERIPRTHLQCDISPHDWTDGVRFAATRAGGQFADIHPGYDHGRSLLKARELLWVEDAGSADATDGFDALMRLQGDWFTQYPKIGETLDTMQPRHRVVECSPIGEPVTMRTRIGGYHGFFKYGIAEARRLAPDGANGYAIVGAPAIAGNDHVCDLQFYRTTVDRSRKLMTQQDVYSDYDLLVRVAAA